MFYCAIIRPIVKRRVGAVLPNVPVFDTKQLDVVCLAEELGDCSLHNMGIFPYN